MNTLNQRQFYLAVSGIAVVSFVLSFITGFSRVTFGAPVSSRYVYLGAIFIIPLVFIGIESLLEHVVARDLVASGSTEISGTPSPTFDPNLTVEWIRKLIANDMWHG